MGGGELGRCAAMPTAMIVRLMIASALPAPVPVHGAVHCPRSGTALT